MKLGLYLPLGPFSIVPLNEILKAAVWNQSTFAKFYLRDMSQQLHNLQDLGPIVAAQKVVGAKSRVPWMPRKSTASKHYSAYNQVINILFICGISLL